MDTITKSVIKISEIPQEYKNDVLEMLLNEQFKNTYIECHIDDSENDDLTLALLEKYPTLKRKISFFIHLD